MSCAAGTRVRNPERVLLRIEDLFEGAELVGLPDEDPVRQLRPLAFSLEPCVKIKADGGEEPTCTREHALLLAGANDRIRASESLNRRVRVRGGAAQVVEVHEVGERRVVHLNLDPPFVYEAEEFLSEE
jgi:hypothetical protein